MLLASAASLPDWESLKRGPYREDGSLRDVYVLGTTRADWARWCAFVNARYPVRWEAEGYNDDAPSPAIAAAYIDRRWDAGRDQRTVSVGVFLGAVRVNCHFFVETEIEHDLDPKEIRSPADHTRVVAYLVNLSTALGKEVLLTEEGSDHAVWFRVNGARMEYFADPYA